MFLDVIFGGGFLGILIWLLLFVCSTIAIAVSIKIFLLLQNKNFSHHETITETETHCQNSNLDDAYKLCYEKNCLYGDAMSELFKHFSNKNQTLEDSLTGVIDKKSQHIQRQINTLQLCANIAPMLGLLGTVVGMVAAFMGLGTALGPEKASVLAVAISQALYTTAAGLLVAVPCLTVINLFRNTLEKRLQDLNDHLNNALFILRD